MSNVTALTWQSWLLKKNVSNQVYLKKYGHLNLIKFDNFKNNQKPTD